MEKYEDGYFKKEDEKEDNEYDPTERRNNCRRKKESQGYLYISMVGWMDRRENGRRSDDEVIFQ
jgi:hypothetical protein